jgi:hypothetical protein
MPKIRAILATAPGVLQLGIAQRREFTAYD